MVVRRGYRGVLRLLVMGSLGTLRQMEMESGIVVTRRGPLTRWILGSEDNDHHHRLVSSRTLKLLHKIDVIYF